MSNNPQIKQPYQSVGQQNRVRFEAALARIGVPFGWYLEIWEDPKSKSDDPRFFVRVCADNDVDLRSGESGYAWKARPWFLDENMTDSEIIRAGILAIKLAADHELKEMIVVDGGRPYDPHINIPKLAAFAKDETVTDQP